jgi:hypothetical protein
VDCCAHVCWPAFDPHSGVLHVDDPLGIESCHNYLDHGESQPTLANLLPSAMKPGDSFPSDMKHGENQLTASYGENQLTVNYGEYHPAIKDHSKDLDNDGEITTKLIFTIATDDPITNAPNDSIRLSIISLCGDGGQCTHTCIVQAMECFHAHVSQAIEVHDKDLDNDGGIITKLISTITTDDPITNVPIDRICDTDVPIDRICLIVISLCGTSLV